VGVSGGPDSMFLLDNMRAQSHKIIVAHINYKKREGSDYDENLTKQYCQKYSLPCEVYQVNGSEYNYISNFQDRARKVRYNFFQKLATKHQTKYIVIAHHWNDHCETYLLQKQRKSLVDYWGMPAKAKQGKYWIIRPLLSLDKQQIYWYLTKKKIDFAVDCTNQLPIYQRNIIRQKLNNLSKKREKNAIEKEIEDKNQELRKTKILVKTAAKQLIVSPSILQLNREIEYSREVYLRLLYFWINEATDGILQQRKKKLLSEIYKQLYISKKNNLNIDLGNNFYLTKINNQAIICPYKIY
jgi:tRNA(Ile)-lysidine synthase